MQTVAAPAGASQGETTARAPLRARISWMLFDWATQPTYTLVQTFLFATYFANIMVSNASCGSFIPAGSEAGACGQTLWGYAAGAAGLLVAVLSPFLGAAAEGGGRRKPWILALSFVLAAALCVLWFAMPNAGLGTISLALLGFIVAFSAAELMSVFSNAIMTGLVPKDEIGRLSGNGWAVGYLGGLVSLVFVAGFLFPQGAGGTTFFGLKPLLPLDPATHTADRLTGPFSALWFVIFILPFFMFVPDRASGHHAPRANTSALADLKETIRQLPSMPDMLKFLIARLFYSDGLAAIFAFGGIYGASVFQWGEFERAIFGVIVMIFGALGAFAGGHLDDKLGPKAVIIGSLVLLLIGALGILSVDKNHILFATEVAPKVDGGGHFSAIGEKVFIAFAIIVSLVAAPVQAASRSLLVHLAPADKITQFFGLFAFSGKATSFMAPVLVALVTQISGSSRIGMSAILAFLVIGAALMLLVKPARGANRN